MKAEIISIGTEILLGHIVNTNAAYLSKKFASLGIDVYRHTTVGDNPKRLVATLEQALSRSGIVVTTGGLGPTVDDITLYSLVNAASCVLLLNKKIKKSIESYFKIQGIKKIPPEAMRQAYIPKGAVFFENKHGTAPGILLAKGQKIIIALPGPPRELIPMFENKVIPYLKNKGFAGVELIKTKTLKVSGLVEAEVNRRVKDLLSMGPKTTIGIYAHQGEVELKITSKAKSENAAMREIKKIERKIRERLNKYLYGADDETLESAAGRRLFLKKKTLSVAESCTGGLVSNRITDVSGSSRYFKMGVVAYSDKSKVNLLDVPEEKIKKHGAVSKEIALLMAEGVKKLSKTDIAIGITGIAGPLGGAKKKPVGLAFIALVNDKIKIVKKYLFLGSRKEIKFQTSTAALDMIRTAV